MQSTFLRELAAQEPELLPRKKRRGLEELRWIVERYHGEALHASVSPSPERLEDAYGRGLAQCLIATGEPVHECY